MPYRWFIPPRTPLKVFSIPWWLFPCFAGTLFRRVSTLIFTTVRKQRGFLAENIPLGFETGRSRFGRTVSPVPRCICGARIDLLEKTKFRIRFEDFFVLHLFGLRAAMQRLLPATQRFRYRSWGRQLKLSVMFVTRER